MAITTVAGLRAAKRQTLHFQKSFAVTNVGGYTSGWPLGNMPVAAATPTATAAGETVSNLTQGALNFTSPSGLQTYLNYINIFASQPMTLFIYDRLWQAQGPAATVTTSHTVNSVALPSRAVLRSVEMWIEISAGMGTGAGNYTLGYTDEAGNAGNTTATHAYTASLVQGRAIPINQLAAGDQGVTSIQTFQRSVSQQSGTASIVMRQLIASIPVPSNTDYTFDAYDLGLNPIGSDAALEFVCFPSTTAQPIIFGSLVIVQG